MYENQFITFSANPSDDCLIPLPVRTPNDLSFYFNAFGDRVMSMAIVTLDCENVLDINNDVDFSDFGAFQANYDNNYASVFNPFENYLAPNDCFRIRIVFRRVEKLKTVYSTPLRYVGENYEQYSTLAYRCDTDTFGLPFGQWTMECRVLLPILLTKPQYAQNDKIYTKRSGENVTLYSEITKEYDGETDYITEEWHRKLLLALSCDYVYINDERITKSEKYDIDWENKTHTTCGVCVAKATFKAKTNVTQRNSNY